MSATATCSRPNLEANATLDICCFQPLNCSQIICGAQNATVQESSDGTYCYLDAGLADQKFDELGNQTCWTHHCALAGDHGFGNSTGNITGNGGGDSGALRGIQGQGQGQLGGGMWLAWLMAVLGLAIWNRRMM
ncbi:hypothetical protein IAU59_001363 [Kwoniella sp. CBS 9459]